MFEDAVRSIPVVSDRSDEVDELIFVLEFPDDDGHGTAKEASFVDVRYLGVSLLPAAILGPWATTFRFS